MVNEYWKHKGRLKKEACKRYKILSEEEKNQKAKKGMRKISKFYWRRKTKKAYKERKKKQLDYRRNNY